MATAPCKNCPERHPCCWDTCEKYQVFKKENEEMKEEMRNIYASCVSPRRKKGQGAKIGGRSFWA